MRELLFLSVLCGIFTSLLGLHAGLVSGAVPQSQSQSQSQSSYNLIEFDNVGFYGTFTPVKKLSDVEEDSCTCEVGDATWFGGDNAPLDEPVSVHFRGPLSLSKFAYYYPATIPTSGSVSNWTRMAYYDASEQTSENVTFLTGAGTTSPCLGNALTYASSNGTGEADSATVLEDDNFIYSDDEFVIFSNISCPSSGYDKSCGVYRSGIPAYEGFAGTYKMFLFEFTMPTETKENNTSYDYYDLPAIWLLNARIPRTSQYPSNENCSCWASGCGEFDIFESMNATQKNHLFSTFHSYQGIEDISTGIQASAYIERDTEGTMMGGVVFDYGGETTVFLSNSTSFSDVIESSDLESIISGISASEEYTTTLATVSATASTTSKSSGSSFHKKPGFFNSIIYATMVVLNLLL